MEDRAAALVHDKVAPAVLEFLVEVYAKHIKRALLTDKRMPDSIFRLAHDIADELWRNALLEIKPRIDQLVESIIQGRRTERQPVETPRLTVSPPPSPPAEGAPPPPPPPPAAAGRRRRSTTSDPIDATVPPPPPPPPLLLLRRRRQRRTARRRRRCSTRGR